MKKFILFCGLTICVLQAMDLDRASSPVLTRSPSPATESHSRDFWLQHAGPAIQDHGTKIAFTIEYLKNQLGKPLAKEILTKLTDTDVLKIYHLIEKDKKANKKK